MPVGEYTKEEIRQIALDAGLPVAHKADSQDICFVPDGDYASFVKREAGEKVPGPGNFVTTDGKIIGQHQGITHYTIGQRKGLGVTFGKPMFVAEIRPETKEIVLAEDKDLFTNVVYADRLNFMSVDHMRGGMSGLMGKIRYNHRGAECVAEQIEEDLIRCEFTEPQRAITPGQALVLYDGDHVVGGGTIRFGNL